MRVVGGVAGGRPLRAPAGLRTRPTADRVREALFNALGDEVPGARVLDLFAGSGALGIEALSRGAASVAFVERDRRAAAAVEANLSRVGLAGGAIHRRSAESFCAAPVGGPFDLVLCDPPYDLPLDAVYRLLAVLHDSAGLAQGATVVIERDRRDPTLDTPAPAWLAARRARTYGDTVLVFLGRPAAACEDERA